jgi:hypothetical protein
MTRRYVVMVVASLLAACGGSNPPAPAEPPHTVRPSIARRDVPPDLSPLVPGHGILATGGGVKSPAFRIIVDTDVKTIYAGSAPPNTPIGGRMTEQTTRELTPPNEEHLMKLCADAWAESAPAAGDAVEGYDEFLIIADGEELFFVQGHGPITRPKAAHVIETLRAAAAM